MLTPPLDPGQRRVAQWGGPLTIGFMWGGWGAMRGLESRAATAVASIAMLLGLVWLTYALGRSTFGSLHGRICAWALSVLLLWPLGAALLPRQSVGSHWSVDAALWAMHATVLTAAAALHARAAVRRSAPGARKWAWSGVTVDLVRRRLGSGTFDPATLSIASTAAACSASVYGALKAQFDAPMLMLVVCTLANMIAFYLYAGPLGRQLGQAWQLRRIERADGGRPFVHEALPELERLRAASLLYRRRS
jgi:hypothetical protein